MKMHENIINYVILNIVYVKVTKKGNLESILKHESGLKWLQSSMHVSIVPCASFYNIQLTNTVLTHALPNTAFTTYN